MTCKEVGDGVGYFFVPFFAITEGDNGKGFHVTVRVSLFRIAWSRILEAFHLRLEEPPINHNDSFQFPLNTLVSYPPPSPLSPSPSLDPSLSPSVAYCTLAISIGLLHLSSTTAHPPYHLDVRQGKSRRNLLRCMEFRHYPREDRHENLCKLIASERRGRFHRRRRRRY